MTNGEGMRGGAVHHTIAAHPFLGEVETASRYRFFSVRDDFLPHEPAELELGAAALAAGAAARCMVMRPEERGRHQEITEHGGWRAYRASRG